MCLRLMLFLCFIFMFRSIAFCHEKSNPGTNKLSLKDNFDSYIPQHASLILPVMTAVHDIDSSINIIDFGAKGDGITNDTKAIQSAIDYANAHPQKNKILIPAGTYLISPIFLKSNIVLILTKNTILKAVSNLLEGQRLVNIILQQNITIYGNGGMITMNRSDYTTGEQRHGLWMNNSKNVTVYDLTSENCGGDGFCIGGYEAAPCQNIALIDCHSYNNRRNALSITNAINVKILGGVYSNSNGTAPQFGIDLEPDSKVEALENILIKGVTTSYNRGGGISIVPGNLTLGSGSNLPVTITIDSCKSIGDGRDGCIRFANSGSPQNKLTGFIKIINYTIEKPQGQPITYLRWNPVNRPPVSFESINEIRNGVMVKIH